MNGRYRLKVGKVQNYWDFSNKCDLIGVAQMSLACPGEHEMNFTLLGWPREIGGSKERGIF